MAGSAAAQMKSRVIFAAVLLIAQASFCATITLRPSKDNTLYESATGTESNGAGDSIFAGQTGFNDNVHIRRAIIAFDIASALPPNAIITDVTLTLFLAQAGPAAAGTNVSLFALTSDWGEGSSVGFSGNPGVATTGDATWRHRFHPGSFWSNPGGDFDPSPSATTTMGFAFQSYSWNGAGLIEDVQIWATNPGANFGWLLRGDESMTNSALRFGSREAAVATNRPQLTILYTAVPEPSVVALLGAGLVLGRTMTARSAHWTHRNEGG